MKRMIFAALALTLFASKGSAEMTCVALEDIDTLGADIGDAVVNNLSLSPGRLWANNSISSAVFSYSVANRNAGPVYVSVDIVMTDEEDFMIAALSAMPPTSISPGRTDAVSRETILSNADFARIAQVCIRATGFAASAE